MSQTIDASTAQLSQNHMFGAHEIGTLRAIKTLHVMITNFRPADALRAALKAAVCNGRRSGSR